MSSCREPRALPSAVSLLAAPICLTLFTGKANESKTWCAAEKLCFQVGRRSETEEPGRVGSRDYYERTGVKGEGGGADHVLVLLEDDGLHRSPLPVSEAGSAVLGCEQEIKSVGREDGQSGSLRVPPPARARRSTQVHIAASAPQCGHSSPDRTQRWKWASPVGRLSPALQVESVKTRGGSAQPLRNGQD